MPGEDHLEGCDVERCPECGHQRLSCGCETGRDSLPWTGTWPGVAECREFGWYARFTDGKGWEVCGKNDKGASEDLNRLYAEAVWDKDKGRLVKR